MDIHTNLTCIFTGLYLRLVMGNKKVLIYRLNPPPKAAVNSFLAITKSNLLVWNKHPGGQVAVFLVCGI